MQMPSIDLSAVDTTTPESGGFECIPAGTYRVLINKAEYRQTRANTGHRLVLELSIMGGEHDGRRLFEGINVFNNNPGAQEIGQRVLASLTDALGIARNGLTDTEQLVDAVVNAEVTCQRIKNEQQREMYGDKHGRQNGVRAFSSGRVAESSAPPQPINPGPMSGAPAPDGITHPQQVVDDDLPF